MSEQKDRKFTERREEKLAERNIPGMMNRNQRFAEVQHAENAGAALRRIAVYFAKEKAMVSGMLIVVVFGTLCGVYAPSLQSNAIDIIAGSREGNLVRTLLLMTAVYLLYSGGQLLQGLISARLSQRIVKRMREELFGKLMDLPVRYLDTHSHGDVMSRMTNDIENNRQYRFCHYRCFRRLFFRERYHLGGRYFGVYRLCEAVQPSDQ